MRFQIIDPDNRVVNTTAFGRRLRRFLRKPEQKMLLPSGASWRTDGSWILADALVNWSCKRLNLACLRDPGGNVGHVIATDRRARAFIDADGVAGQVELMTKMALIMHAPNVVLGEFSTDDAIRAGYFYHEDVAVEMAMRLLHRFGKYDPDLLSPSPPSPVEHPSHLSLFPAAFA